MGELDRMRWQCRSSMLELDIALGGFFDAHYENLQPAEQESFQALLREKDQDILDWLYHNKPVDKPELEAIVNLVRGRAADH